MSQYLGDISAYALAVSQGYTGTEEEYAELMASYATVGQTAVTAAQTATTKASEAATSATTATNKASEATTAATTATTKAAEAQADADAAALDASQALSAASTATTKATEATTAAATATSAKTDAVAANTAAQSAKTAAQTAQTGAETAAASVESSAEQIATNAEDISQLKSEITALAPKEDMLKAFPTDTAWGSVASFADGANVPVKSLIVNIDPVQSGSGDPSPDNVRPISGWNEVNVQRTGENLFPYKDVESQTKNGVTATVEKSDGIITNIHLQGTATAAFSIPFYINGEDNQWVLPKGEYKLYIGGDKPTQDKTFDINIRKAGETSDISAASTVRTITLSEQTTFGSAYIWIYSGTVLNNNIIPVIVQSGVDTSIKYPITQRQSITIDLGQTVYGGKLDVLSGVLTIDNGHKNKDNVRKEIYTLNGYPVWLMEYETASIGSNEVSAISSVLKQGNYNGIYAGQSNIVAQNSQGRLIANVDGISSVSDIDTWLNANPDFLVVYKLATPLTIQLDPHEVTALLGSNNIWADTGDSAVEYRADPTLYIQRLTEPDADMVADANIVSGQYFMVGNTLYKATANIASGAIIAPNVNCTRKSLSEALNELNA